MGGVCPGEHELCSCAEGAAEKAKADQAKVMQEWEEAQRQHRVLAEGTVRELRVEVDAADCHAETHTVRAGC